MTTTQSSKAAETKAGSTRHNSRRISTETKAAFKTTEFYIYILAVAGVIVASALVGTNAHTGVNGAASADYFRADKAWLYIVILTVGYMVTRGIAKSGSRQFYDDDNH